MKETISGSHSLGSLIVKFTDENNKENIKNSIKEKLSLKQLNTKKTFQYSRIELLNLHEDDDFDMIMNEFNNHPGTHYAHRDFPLYPCNPEIAGKFKEQWGLLNTGQIDKYGNAGQTGIDLNVRNAWETTTGADSVLVAVIDTGIDINHKDLKNSIYLNHKELNNNLDDDKNNYSDDISGWDFINKDNSVYDSIEDSKHGTEVAGIIAGSGDDSGIIGVAPNVKLLPLKIMDRHNGCTSAAIEAIEYAKAIGARIVNCSWGDYCFNPALKFHIENSGMLFICAAGNDGLDLKEKPFYPACFNLSNVISVAAVNSRGKLWSLSNFGSNIDLAAPGVNIISSIPSEEENRYDFDSGTSLAAPHVTGTAALVMSVRSNITPEETKAIILKNVVKLPELEGLVKTGGMVNAYKTLIGSINHI